jgi:hypothetical protein
LTAPGGHQKLAKLDHAVEFGAQRLDRAREPACDRRCGLRHREQLAGERGLFRREDLAQDGELDTVRGGGEALRKLIQPGGEPSVGVHVLSPASASRVSLSRRLPRPRSLPDSLPDW